jgi:hypothetical protein
MQTTEIDPLLEKLAAAIPELRLAGEEQEEYCTTLLQLQHQLDTGKPNQLVVYKCLAYFAHCLRRGGVVTTFHREYSNPGHR